ncbi:hypothetical protein [Pseudomonas sp. AP-1]|uniref:hypothetical protein n=1 Tax=Pseudomonas sp. AP-1 TaxID=3231718 RepID=UPI0035AE8E49
MAGMPWDDYAAPSQAAPAPVEDAAPWDDYAEPAPSVPSTTPSTGFLDSIESAIDNSVVGDVGRSLARGGVAVGDAAMGLAGLASGGAIPRAIGYDSSGIRNYLDEHDTPERQASRQALERATGFGGTLEALMQNPGNIPHLVVESAPSMLLGGGVGRGVALGAKALGAVPAAAGLLGAGTGEGIVAAGQQAEQTRQATGTLTPGQSGLALASGALTGLLGAAGARIGRRLGVADIDAQMAGANGVDVAKGLVNRALTGTGIESLEELTQSGQQQVLTNLATDRPALEGVDKQMVMGGVVGGAMGAGAGLRRPNMSVLAEQTSAPQQPEQPPVLQTEPAAVPAPAPQAAPAQPAPTPFAGSQDINPLLDRLGVQGEQRAKTLDLLRPVELNVEDARRGVVSNAERDRLAALIGLQGNDAAIFNRRIGQAWNTEETAAAINHVQGRLTDVLDLQQKIANGQATDIDRADFVNSLSQLRSTFGDLAGARAEAGRALATYRKQALDYRQAQAVLEAVGGVNGADDAAAALGEAIRSGGLQNAARLVTQPEGKMQRLFGYYYRAALLSGVRTHAVNIVSNTLTLGNEMVERAFAGGIGGAKRALTGGKAGQTLFAEPLDLLIGTVRGTAKAGTAALDAFKTGESAVLGGQAKQDNAAGLNNAPRKPGVLNALAYGADKLASVPYRALGAEDAWFATLNYEAELRTLARQQAVAERRSGAMPQGVKLSQRIDQILQSPSPQMIEAAGEHARTQTFNSKAGTYAQAIMAAKAKAPWLNVIVPFVRTPANIVKFGLKRTPLAPFFKEVRADFAAGGARQERAAARILWGTSVMIGAGALAQAGYITGAGPDDRKEREALMATGWRPHSIKVGDTYYEYNRLDPFAQWLSLASDLATQDYQHKDAGDLAASVLGSLVNNTINKTYMQGLSDFVEFLQDPKRNGEWYTRRMAGTLAQPVTLLSNIASENDPFAREGNSILDAIKYRLPGLRQSLAPKLDALGEPVPNRSYPGGALSIAAPIAQSQETDDPVRLELGRLGFAPPEFQKSLTLSGKKWELSPEQHHELAQLAGQLTQQAAQRLMRSPGWAKLDDEGRKDALDAAGKKARAAVRMAAIPLATAGKRAALDKLKNTLNRTEVKR